MKRGFDLSFNVGVAALAAAAVGRANFHFHFGKTLLNSEICRGSGRIGGHRMSGDVALFAELPNISPPLNVSGGT